MPKKDCRVRNWKDYNQALIKRGSITFWVDQKSTQNWYAIPLSEQGRGRPLKYSDMAFIAVLTLKQVYHLPLRAACGFICSLFKLMNIAVEIPCYSQVCRRQAGIKLPPLPRLAQPIHMVLDSSGLKIFGEGEWKVRQHGWSKHRMWRKLHIGMDEQSQLIVSAVLTENSCGDDKKLPDLLNSYRGKIHQVSADGAYDSHECFDKILSLGAKATIPIQPNPKHKAKIESQIKNTRDRIAFETQQLGSKEWKLQNGYHRRSLVENLFYRYKQLLGDKLSARKLENQRTEALVRCHALNKMTQATLLNPAF